MPLPTTVQIGAHAYSVVVKKFESVDSESVCGYVDNSVSTIFINDEQPVSLKWSTLLHEAMHVMNSTLSENHTGHALQDSLSEQIWDFLSRNHLLNEDTHL